MRSILFVAQVAPPSTLVAARRVAGFTKYLARLGHRVTVLTSGVSGDGPIEGAAEVVRTGDLMLTRLNWRRRHFRAFAGEETGGYVEPSVLERVVVPDVALATWLPYALPRALRLAQDRSTSWSPRRRRSPLTWSGLRSSDEGFAGSRTFATAGGSSRTGPSGLPAFSAASTPRSSDGSFAEPTPPLPSRSRSQRTSAAASEPVSR